MSVLPLSAANVGAQAAPDACKVANTTSGASLAPDTVTVNCCPATGVLGLTVAPIVPVGGRKVTVCVNGVVAVVGDGAIQIQNVSVWAWGHVMTSLSVKAP